RPADSPRTRGAAARPGGKIARRGRGGKRRDNIRRASARFPPPRAATPQGAALGKSLPAGANGTGPPPLQSLLFPPPVRPPVAAAASVRKEGRKPGYCSCGLWLK